MEPASSGGAQRIAQPQVVREACRIWSQHGCVSSADWIEARDSGCRGVHVQRPAVSRSGGGRTRASKNSKAMAPGAPSLAFLALAPATPPLLASFPVVPRAALAGD